ncbi:glycosyltransferase family 4 protein [Ureibacillus sinduriensis]|uniref:glycosyltransferase family 4 protein n=1 Tax=Ureibacillus sinduriensis TaxID=561440 RepID=UPI000561CCA4|nr:glycosyltransferase family 4 protein [Ureibacillus sinduriensis]
MNIWLLNHYAVSPNSTGGTRHFDLAEQLVKKGHIVTIFASSFNHFNRKETQTYKSRNFYKTEVINGVRFVWFKTPQYKNTLERLLNISCFGLFLQKSLKYFLTLERPDLIIGSSVHPLTALIGLKFAKKNNIKFYFEERDLWPQTFVDFGLIKPTNPLAKILYKIEKNLYLQSDKIIFLFENAYLYAQSKGANIEKIIYLPNGFNPNRNINNQRLDSGLEKIFKRLDGKKICTYIGSMNLSNNLESIVELAKIMRNEENYHFLLIGNGNTKKALIELVKTDSLNNITIYDSVPKSSVPAILKKSHFGFISIKSSPLYKWGMSMNKLYDYLSEGLPIICYTDMEDLGEIEKSRAFYKSSDIYELKDFLLTIDNFNSQFVKEFAYKHYSWDILSDKLIEVMENDKKND